MKEIKLTQGFVALIDDEDFELVNQFNWYVYKRISTFYARRSNSKNNPIKYNTLMHRLIMNAQSGQIIDHKDGDGCNNQRSNLRFCTPAQNCMNRKPRKNCSSKYMGVYLNIINSNNKVYRYWMSVIRIDGKNKSLGSFKTEEEAALAYNKMASLHHKEFARLNVINS